VKKEALLVTVNGLLGEPKKERWLLIHSKQAAKKQNQTLSKRIASALKQAQTEAKKLKAIHFA